MNEGWEGEERHRGERKREGKERSEDQAASASPGNSLAMQIL